MRKLQHRKIKQTARKALIFTLAAGLTLLPGCRTTTPNQFKNKQPMVDNMEKQEKKEERKIGTLGIPTLKKKQEEKKEEPEKIKQEEKKQEVIGEIQGIEGFGSVPPYKKLKPRQPIH